MARGSARDVTPHELADLGRLVDGVVDVEGQAQAPRPLRGHHSAARQQPRDCLVGGERADRSPTGGQAGSLGEDRLELERDRLAARALALWAAWFGLRGEIRLDLDVAISRLIDFMLTIPTLPLLLVLSALLRDPEVAVGRWAQGVFGDAASVFIIITILVFFGWLGTARLVRGSILSLREMDYATAAQALGATDFRIMFRHLVPNTMAPLIVQATLQVGQAILVEAALSFLGFGIQPPVATWGNMLTNAQETIWEAPMLAIWPGLFIFVTVMCFNFLGDGLQDAFDPRAEF